jgi:uncharacterized protein
MDSIGIDDRIISFIHKHHIFTLATAANNEPYTCTCFYVYIEKLNLFVFTSDTGTRHVTEMGKQSRVAGTIALETKIVGKIQGIQFTGDSFLLDGELYKQALKAYLKKFPYAGFKELTLWGIEPDFIKMTHNILGFGTKLIWQKDKNRTL